MKAVRHGRVVVSREGFTLLEIVVVFLVLGIASTIALPTFDRMMESDQRVRTDGDLVLRLTRCHETAIRLGTPQLLDVSSNGTLGGSYVDRESRSDMNKIALVTPKAALLSSRVRYHCLPTGAVYGPANHQPTASPGRLVLIDPLLGRIRSDP